VQREEVRLEREPITDANAGRAVDGPEISEEEHEVTLHTEEPVVEKRTVPKERVRLDKDVHTDEKTVSEDVRRERIDAEGDAERRL
jgi:stress response protein YsnF